MIYADGGGLVFSSGDETYFCMWEGRVGRCEVDEDGFLDFVDEAEELRAEIARLEAVREPLIPRKRIEGVLCTGSMEPAITCLDRATWLENVRPEDIVVGAVVSWRTFEDCGVAVHRVVDVKVEDGTYYYLTKGDANLEPDGCWIPDTHIDGYVLELSKNAEPWNAELRDRVNEAAALSEAANEEYYRTLDEHGDYCARWSTVAGECALPDDDKLDQEQRLFDRVEVAYQNAIALYDYHSCWLKAALNATHRDGAAPLYTDNCGRPAVVPLPARELVTP